jgi:hypothetical protein
MFDFLRSNRRKSSRGGESSRKNNRLNKLNRLNKFNRTKSYTPTINKQLVSFKSFSNASRKNTKIGKRQREKIIQCTLEPILKIMIDGTCHSYSSEIVKKYLLKRLSKNKHVNPDLIITPKQASANCWFNTMFVSLFISDKGRKFFHFLRQLMIEGNQIDGQVIPTKLWNGFALLNFAIEASLSGTEYAYKLNTNIIISHIYKSIPDNYKNNLPYLTKVGNAGNPLRYYLTLMYYLENRALQLLFCETFNKEVIREKMLGLTHIPHIIVVELFEGMQEMRPLIFVVHNGNELITYALDSSVVRDISNQHFCAMITCEGQEMGYDGISHSRMVHMKWKPWLNTDTIWKFKGNTMKWSFLQSYQMLVYYRV